MTNLRTHFKCNPLNLFRHKGDIHYLVLLLLQCPLSLLKCSLKLFLLDLKPAPLLVQLVDGTAAISKLVQQVLNFVGKIFVLTLDYVQLLDGFVVSSLETEDFRAVVPPFRPARLQLPP